MARILYAVQGEGMGHAIRSKVVIDYLIKKKHEVIIIAPDRAYEFLSKHFKNVKDIHCHHIVYKKNRAMTLQTVMLNARKFPKLVIKNFPQIIKILRRFKPEVVITDFEPFSAYISVLFRIPVIAIDNISMMVKAKIKIPRREIISYLMAALIARSFIIKANKYIITTFFYPKIKNPKNTIFVPPSLRPEILKAKSTKGRHILVYQTSQTNEALLNALKQIKEKFIIYGFNIAKKDKNLTFRKFSEKGFIKDFSSCKALIVNGGFTVLSEAVYLKKPILSIPVRNQFEQILNARYVEKLGYGEYHKKATAESIKSFLKNLPKYEKNIKKYKQDGNKALFREVDKAIKQVLKG